jgi:hypothetical protein
MDHFCRITVYALHLRSISNRTTLPEFDKNVTSPEKPRFFRAGAGEITCCRFAIPPMQLR